MNEAAPSRYPPWKHALQILIDEGLRAGDEIGSGRFAMLFGLQKPVTATDQKQYDLQFQRQFKALQEALKKEHRLVLETLWGKHAYRVVPPQEQTAYALSTGRKEMKSCLSKLADNLKYIRHEELTDDERRRNADAQAKTAMLAGMIRKQHLIR